MPFFKLPDYISLNIPFIFVLLLIAAAGAVSVYFYRRTVPEIKNGPRYFLTALRTLVIALLFLLMFAPKLSLTFSEKIFPKIGIFVDNSASMAVDGRMAEVDRFVKLVKENIKQSENIFWFRFNNKITSSDKDSASAVRFGTDFNRVIRRAKKEKFSKIFIISDGNNTESGRFDELPSPIITIGVGEIAGGADMYISDIKFNSIAQVGKEETIEVVIGNKDCGINNNLRLKLFSGGKVITSKLIEKFSSGTEESIFLNYTPRRKGLSRYLVVLDTLKGEKNIKNNRRTFVQNSIDKKRKIGLFIGVPDYDSKFIALLLSKNDEFKVYKYIDKIDGISASFDALDSLDVLVFSNFPGPFTKSSLLSRLKNMIVKNHTGVIIKQGGQSDYNKLRNFDFLLPYNRFMQVRKAREFTAIQGENPLLILFDDALQNGSFWQKIPPVTAKYLPQDLKKGAEVILWGGDGVEKTALIGSYHNRSQNSFYMTGSGYWRWYFNMTLYSELAEGFPKLLSAMVYHISNASKLEQITIDTGKRVFQLGERIPIKINLYNTDFEPIVNGNVELDVLWNKQNFKIEVNNDSTGNYSAEFYPPGDGKFEIKAKGYSAGALLGEKKIRLEVIPIEKEFLSTTQNAGFLQMLARKSGGKYFNLSANQDSILSEFSLQPRSEIMDKEIELWYKPFMVILIIILISLEWIIRRKYRLV